MRGPTPSFFVCTRLFVLWFGRLVLYKYWPMPTCIFFSLVIISPLLVISACFLLSENSIPLIPTLNTKSLFSVTHPRTTLTLLLRTSQNLLAPVSLALSQGYSSATTNPD